MTKADYLEALISFFMDNTLLDHGTPHVIAKDMTLKDIVTFRTCLISTDDFKNADIYLRMKVFLSGIHPNKVIPVISPDDHSVFEKSITLEDFAAEIAENTPDEVF